jgi:glycosyltransferase involved in cell wall biosynthesis
MRFGNSLYQELGIPYAVHIMDDSVSFINKSMILRKSLQRIIERDYSRLIENATVHMCISESMASEYKLRYGKTFLTFRNPIEIERWLPYQKNDLRAQSDELKIIYTGRLFPPTYSSLVDMCRVVDRLNNNGRKVVLDIFTYDTNISFSESVSDFIGINLKNPVDVMYIPQLVQKYDIFFLCLDFDNYAKRYAQYSISTRTSEGMISAVPILMYGPSSSAQYGYFAGNKSAYIVGERNIDLLEEAVNEIWHNYLLRKELSQNATRCVMVENNSVIVREKFRKALCINLNKRLGIG